MEKRETVKKLHVICIFKIDRFIKFKMFPGNVIIKLHRINNEDDCNYNRKSLF